MTSLGPQLHRATFVTAVLLLLQVKGVKSLKGSTSLDEDRSQREKTVSAGRSWRERANGERGGSKGTLRLNSGSSS